jgi:hypothetical protein
MGVNKIATDSLYEHYINCDGYQNNCITTIIININACNNKYATVLVPP